MHANAIGRNGGLENCICCDAQGGNNGQISGTITGDHNNRVADYTQLLCYENSRRDKDPKEADGAMGTLQAHMGTGGNNVPLVQSINCQGGSNIGVQNDVTETITAASNSSGNNLMAVAIAENVIGRQEQNGGNGIGAQEELAYTQNATGVMGVCTKGNGDAFVSDVHTSLSAMGGGQAGQGYPACVSQSTVRRLLPVECERLMGFPDNHTRISWNGKPEEECPDAPRYKACGNSMCVNCMEWIGRRIEEFDNVR